ncbi:uncharacterized protein LOC131691339 isoform X2 [Topomyia yanbarensis]|uniref:uncharacterized protein LOC131691339 isoform X2 n=1 Tax=Topomyia yanbarensis TaxID=2498891 RepID=UPI00273CD5F5|nr:uncharacterized protein LOC131691339 isoform X2 [Topomyia yanbarensis]
MAQMNMAAMIEPYRRGSSFANWVERLGYFFDMNNVKEHAKKAHFITLSGPIVFSELKLLFPTTNLSDVSYETMIDKLKSRFDKTESELIQRYKFNNRKQNPGESAEDFVLAVKLQAEFCNFGTFKEAASRERIVAGLRDVQLQKTLLNESKLTLDSAEKIIATWELAGNNAKTLGIGAGDEQIAALKQSESRKCGSALEKLAVTYDRARNLNQSPQAGGSRGSIKSRLGYKPYNTHSHAGPREGRYWEKHVRFQPADYRRSRDEQRYETRSCDFCGKRGHLKRKCFKLKSLRKDAVNSVISAGPEVNSLGDLFHRMRTETDSDDEKDFSDTCWKRRGHGTSKPTSNF